LVGAPGGGCGGKCGTARFACEDADRVACVDPVKTPGPDVVCSSCGTVKYACAPDGASTTCPRPDDTGPGVDFSFVAKEPVRMPRLLERTCEHLLFFKARHNKLSPFKVTLTMRRVPYVCPRTESCTSLDARCSCALSSMDAGATCGCTVTSSIDDPISVTFLKGSGPETPSHHLAHALVESDKIPDVAAPVTIALVGSGDSTLWTMAAAVARVEGVSTTARVLRLDAKRLAARAAKGETADLSLGHPMQFVELSAMPARAGAEPIIVDLIGRDGERVRVELPARAVASGELVAVASAFWSRGR